MEINIKELRLNGRNPCEDRIAILEKHYLEFKDTNNVSIVEFLDVMKEETCLADLIYANKVYPGWFNFNIEGLTEELMFIALKNFPHPISDSFLKDYGKKEDRLIRMYYKRFIDYHEFFGENKLGDLCKCIKLAISVLFNYGNEELKLDKIGIISNLLIKHLNNQKEQIRLIRKYLL